MQKSSLISPLSAVTGETDATSAISWSGIIGGALAITAITTLFVLFGDALGLAPSSPPDTGRLTTTITSATAIWLIVSQWIASGVGGYLTGRLRTQWAGVHTHEVMFRDTAHGFLAWALALVIGAALVGHGFPKSTMSLIGALSILIGAFIAVAAAALGGAQRDEWEDAVRKGTYE